MFNKKYNVLGLIFLNFKISPICSCAIIVQNIVEGSLPTILMFTISNFIDNVINGKNERTIYNSLFCLISVMVIQFLISSLFSIVHRKLNVDLSRYCDYEGVKRVASLEYSYIESKKEYENCLRVLSSASNYIYNAYQMLLSISLLIIRITGLLIVFFRTRLWWIGLFVALYSLPVFIISYRSGKKVYEFYRTHFEDDLEMNHQTYILKSREVVDERTLFEFSDKINKRWLLLRKKYFKNQMNINKKVEFQLKIPFIISWILIGVFMIVMAKAVFIDVITIGLFISMVNNSIDLNTCVNSTLSSLAIKIAQTKSFICDLNDFCKYTYNENMLVEPAEKVHFETLEFKNVSFNYPGSDRIILNNISFKIETGKSYAFIGENGSGKSTIIKLIIGLYKDYDGTILINGKDIREFNNSNIKAMFGILFQDYAKYKVSLKENIDIGAMKYKSNEKSVFSNRNKSIEATKLNTLIQKLPNGINTELGKIDSLGQNVSGGEWQRIAIARLLMSNADVYILDEPTSSIDPILEECIYSILAKKISNQTSITISHRLGVTKMLDHIFVFENGNIVEQGNHECLMEEKGRYYDMYIKQQGRYI